MKERNPQVALRPETYERLKERGRKGDTFDDIVQTLLEGAPTTSFVQKARDNSSEVLGDEKASH